MNKTMMALLRSPGRSGLLFSVVSCLLSFMCFGQKTEERFTVNGTIKGLGNDSVIIVKRNGNIEPVIIDTIIAISRNDHFSFTGKAGSPQMVYANLGGFNSRKNFSFFLENGKIDINGNIDSTEKISVTGTPNNNDYTAHSKTEGAIYDRVKLLQLQLKDIGRDDEKAKILSNIDALRDSVIRVRIDFVRSHPQSMASSIYLYVLQDHIPILQLEDLYNRLSQMVKESDYGVIVGQKIIARKRVAIGQPAPEFATVDMNGSPVNLSAFRGKYVLLEFWASWCVPCRAQNPYLVEAYKKYKDKGLVIIGVSMDHIGEKWKEAIQKDGLTWIHVSELKQFDSQIAKLYGVQPIPDNFLISPDGKIIERGLRGEDFESKLRQIFD